jgi:hypothetical protein
MIARTRLCWNSQDYDSKDKKDSVGIVRIMIAIARIMIAIVKILLE